MSEAVILKAVAIGAGGLVGYGLALKDHPIGAFFVLMITFMTAGL